MHFIGVDHHKQTSTLAVLDADGRMVATARLANRREEIGSFLREAAPDGFKAVVEVGKASYVMADLLRELGGEVVLADPYKVKAIAHARIKTDARDAKTLAHLLRTDLIPEVYQRDAENREAQRVLRLRAYWIHLRVQVRNKIRALLAQQREEVRVAVDAWGDRLFGPKGLDYLAGVELREHDRAILQGLLRGYRTFEEFQRDSDQLVGRVYRTSAMARRIDTVPGFGTTLATLVAVEIAEIRRFPRVEALHSYAGLIPSTHSSGERTYHGHITPGNLWLRWALVEAVYPALRKDPLLGVFYHRIARRRGPNIAKVATARRLLTIIYRMLTQDRDYRTSGEAISAA